MGPFGCEAAQRLERVVRRSGSPYRTLNLNGQRQLRQVIGGFKSARRTWGPKEARQAAIRAVPSFRWSKQNANVNRKRRSIGFCRCRMDLPALDFQRVGECSELIRSTHM